MLKKIIILSLIFSAIGSMKVNVEMKNRYGLMQVSANNICTDNVNLECEKISKEEAILKVEEYKKSGQYSKAIRFIEENIEEYKDDEQYNLLIEELNLLVKEHLKEYSLNIAKNNKELKKYYKKINKEKINDIDVKSHTDQFLFISIEEQKIYYYEKSQNQWILKNEFICSTGEEGTETPVGVFKVGAKGEWFHSPKFNKGGKYYTQFSGEFLIHSVPYYPDKIKVWEGKLGTPVSHGCVRTSTEDAKIIYEKVLYDSTVIIY